MAADADDIGIGDDATVDVWLANGLLLLLVLAVVDLTVPVDGCAFFEPNQNENPFDVALLRSGLADCATRLESAALVVWSLFLEMDKLFTESVVTLVGFAETRWFPLENFCIQLIV